MRKARIIFALVFWAILGVLLYLISFTVFTKAPPGMTSVSSRGAPARPPDPIIIYVSHSPTINRIGKVVYYPVIRIGEATGCWRFVDDASGFDGDPCLLTVLLAQPELHPW